jgi:anaerobic selenocysteine-containing dehydrogenase
MSLERVAGYCGFCGVHCPVVTTVRDGRPAAVEPDPTHPLGGAICAKGRAAVEFHDHGDRVNFPLRRTRPKTDPDPGWARIGWDEALDLTAARLLAIRAESGPQAVAFTKGTVGGTALTDTERWFNRLQHHFGSPNYVGTTHLCQWPRDTGGAHYTFGTPRLPLPDVEASGAVLLWGSNPTANFLSLGVAIAAAKARGARLVVVDPRRIGLANKADVFLQVRPGTDGALALALIHVLIEERRYDEGFVREWTNGPLLVRDDTGALLLTAVTEGGEPAAYDARTGRYATPPGRLALRGSHRVRLADGTDVVCRPVFERLAALAASCPPAVAARITGAPPERIVAAARLLADHRPVSHYFHNGLVQHTNATQAARAIEILYALLGDFDRVGGNVEAPGPRVDDVADRAVLPAVIAATRLGRGDRPIGPPAVPGVAAAYDLYGAILEGEPYPVRGLVALGANMLLANGDTLRGRAALERLEFFVQVELTHTPTSRFADVLLPAASWLESAALKVGHPFPHAAQGRVQLRAAATRPLHERRSDVDIVFDLACRLGLRDAFWNGDVEAGYDFLLAPSGLTVETLRAAPHGAAIPTGPIRHRKYAEPDPATGAPRGFATPTRKVELYGTRFADHGLPPLPEYVEPALSPVSAPEVAARYPLVLTNAKRAQYLHSQHRGLPSLRKTAANPTAELHPDTAGRYGIRDGEWVVIETPSGRARAQARVTDTILPGVVCCTHGWWEPCAELGLPGFDPFSAEGANQNLLVLNDRRDPVSGGTPHRSTLCRVEGYSSRA